MTTANIKITKVLLGRGNTAISTNYTGVMGEVTMDTTLKTLRVHDGVVVGGTRLATYSELANVSVGNIDLSGYATTAQITAANANAAVQAAAIASINANVLAANAAITALQSNAAVQATILDTLTSNAATQAITLNTLTSNAGAQADSLTALLANAATQQNSLTDLLANAVTQAQQIANAGTSYGNANVQSYLAAFDGNILPSANVTYSLGDATHQWRDLWVSNNTIYIGNTPIRVDGGTLLVNNAPITGGSTYGNANVATYLTRGNVTVGNITIQDEYDQQWRFSNGALIWPAGDGTPTGPYIEGSSLFTVYPENDGEFRIQTYSTTAVGSRQWKFNSEGNLIVPDDATIWSDLDLRLYAETGNIALGNQNGTWMFNADGTTNFPNDRLEVAQGNTFTIGTTTAGTDDNEIQVNSKTIDIIASNINAYSWSELFLNNIDTSDPVAQIRVNAYGGTEKVWTFDGTGNLTFPTGANTNGSSYNGGSANVAVSLNSTNSNGDTVSIIAQGANSRAVIETYSNAGNNTWRWIFDETGTLTLPSSPTSIQGESNHDFTIGTNNGNVAYTFTFTQSGSLNVPVDIEASGNVGTPIVTGYGSGNLTVMANTQSWLFDTDGILTLPSNSQIRSVGNTGVRLSAGASDVTGMLLNNTGDAEIYAFGNVSLYADSDNTSMGWTFGIDGTLTAPGNITAGNLVPAVTNDSSLGSIGQVWKKLHLGTQGIALGNVSMSELGSENLLLNVGETGTTSWKFDTDGNIKGPQTAALYGRNPGIVFNYAGTGLDFTSMLTEGSFIDPNITINTGNANTLDRYKWIFGSNGNLTAPGNITANYFVGDGSQLTNVTTAYGNTQVAAYLANYDGIINFTASPATINTGEITAANVSSTNGFFWGNGVAYSTGGAGTYGNTEVAAYMLTFINANFDTLLANNFTSGNAFISGAGGIGYTRANAVSRIGNVYSNYGNFLNLTSGNIFLSGAGGIGYTAANAVSRIGNVYSTYGNFTNFSTANAILTGGYINTMTNVVSTLGSFTNFESGNVLITGGYISSIANATVSGNVTAGNLIGYGSNTSIVAGAYTSTFDTAGMVTVPNLTVTGTASIPNITVSGNVNITGGEWQEYTPVWTSADGNAALGNGFVEGRYKKIGKVVHVYIYVGFGSSTTFGSGEYKVSLPVAGRSVGQAMLSLVMHDVGTRLYNSLAHNIYSTYGTNVSSVTLFWDTGVVTHSAPFTWTDGDYFVITGTYEAGS